MAFIFLKINIYFYLESMAHLIRRHSMERLELYDLDKFSTSQSNNYQLPPPLPPPRISYHHHHHHHRRTSINPTLERYQFLCNTSRSKTDPIYAATPMFTTIPQSSQEKPHRQLLGTYIRLENVKPLPLKTPISPEPKKIEIIKDKEEENKEEKENESGGGEKEDNHNSDDESSSSSSSSSSDEQEKAGGGNDEILNDDDNDKKGVVEAVFNRDKKDEV